MLSAAEILRSLGLEVTGAGKGAEVWYVGTSEQTGAEQEEASLFMWTSETPSGEAGWTGTRQ
jgi:hypothetical protein